MSTSISLNDLLPRPWILTLRPFDRRNIGGGSLFRQALENTGSNKSKIYRVTARNKESGSIIKVEADQLLIAIGRIPNSDTLDLGKTGVKLDERGYVMTDEFLQTNI